MQDMTSLKQSKFTILALASISLLCLSCSKKLPGPYEYNELNKTPFVEQSYEGYYKVGDFPSLSSNGYTIDTDYSSIYQSGNIVYSMPSTGEVPLLVVPIDFDDSVGNSVGLGYIDSAFTGNKESNQYVSVSEYYAYSSCDRLHIKPYVVKDFFRSPTYPKVGDLSSIVGDSGTTSALTTLYSEAKTWLSSSHKEIDLSSFSYKSKNNKEILPIYFIYNAPYAGEYDPSSTSRSSMLWAFTISRPAPISWSSIDMLHPNEGKVDAHTFIHETGHLFGLDDYYDPRSSEAISRISHLGRMDMMDCSLGDQNAFSKMLLNWERPYVPTSSCEITLHQGSGNNESILLPLSSWNKTLYDDYLLMEFYTPTGLNYVDTYFRSDVTMKLFENPGIKIYKVDASLELYNGSYPSGVYLNEKNYNGGRLSIGRNNSSFSSPLIQLLNKHQNNANPTPYFIASDHEEDARYLTSNGSVNIVHLSEALFYEGDTIDETHFPDIYKQIGTRMKIKTLNSSYATISFEFVKEA